MSFIRKEKKLDKSSGRYTVVLISSSSPEKEAPEKKGKLSPMYPSHLSETT